MLYIFEIPTNNKTENEKMNNIKHTTVALEKEKDLYSFFLQITFSG